MGSRNIKRRVLGIVATVWLAAAGLAYAQEPAEATRKNPDTFQLKETEITGKLKDVLGSLKLLETEVVGTVERPRLSYSLPWKDPDPLLLDEGEMQGVFLEEIYTPLDKDTYSQAIRSEKARQAP
ncbi:MAG TPA: hypothetical protein VLY20_05280 [Nitrospiria bacterium]|nr:hypothetical protein [Nitrospiria bacterium]